MGRVVSAFLRLLPVKTWLIIALVALIVVGLVMIRGAWNAAQTARQGQNQAEAVGTQLDKVAAQTPAIRQEQAAKEREVNEIEGSDTRLPDGYGAELERVRRGNANRDTR